MEYWHEIVKEDNNLPCRHFFSNDGHPNMFFAHCHSDIEIMYILTGTLTATIETHSYVLNAGDVIIINSNELHSTSCTNSVTSAYLLQINTSYLKECSRIPNTPYFHIPLYCSEKTTESSRRIIRMLQTLITSFFEQSNKTAKFNYIFLLSILDQIIFYLYQFFQDECPEHTKQSKKNFDRILKIDSYIKQHYCENITLNEVASYVGLSSTYFSKNFHRIFGMTFSQYLCSIRLTKAYDDIISTTLPIAYIAETAGFSNYPFFQAQFKQRYGCTPSKCRKMHSPQLPTRCYF